MGSLDLSKVNGSGNHLPNQKVDNSGKNGNSVSGGSIFNTKSNNEEIDVMPYSEIEQEFLDFQDILKIIPKHIDTPENKEKPDNEEQAPLIIDIPPEMIEQPDNIAINPEKKPNIIKNPVEIVLNPSILEKLNVETSKTTEVNSDNIDDICDNYNISDSEREEFKNYNTEVEEYADGSSRIVLKDDNGRTVKSYSYSEDKKERTISQYTYNEDGSYVVTQTKQKELDFGGGSQWANLMVYMKPMQFDSDGNFIGTIKKDPRYTIYE